MDQVVAYFIDFLKANSSKYMVIDLIPLKTKELRDKLENNNGQQEEQDGEDDEEEEYDDEEDDQEQQQLLQTNGLNTNSKPIKKDANNQLYVPKIQREVNQEDFGMFGFDDDDEEEKETKNKKEQPISNYKQQTQKLFEDKEEKKKADTNSKAKPRIKNIEVGKMSENELPKQENNNKIVKPSFNANQIEIEQLDANNEIYKTPLQIKPIKEEVLNSIFKSPGNLKPMKDLDPIYPNSPINQSGKLQSNQGFLIKDDSMSLQSDMKLLQLTDRKIAVESEFGEFKEIDKYLLHNQDTYNSVGLLDEIPDYIKNSGLLRPGMKINKQELSRFKNKRESENSMINQDNSSESSRGKPQQFIVVPIQLPLFCRVDQTNYSKSHSEEFYSTIILPHQRAYYQAISIQQELYTTWKQDMVLQKIPAYYEKLPRQVLMKAYEEEFASTIEINKIKAEFKRVMNQKYQEIEENSNWFDTVMVNNIKPVYQQIKVADRFIEQNDEWIGGSISLPKQKPVFEYIKYIRSDAKNWIRSVNFQPINAYFDKITMSVSQNLNEILNSPKQQKVLQILKNQISSQSKRTPSQHSERNSQNIRFETETNGSIHNIKLIKLHSEQQSENNDTTIEKIPKRKISFRKEIEEENDNSFSLQKMLEQTIQEYQTLLLNVKSKEQKQSISQLINDLQEQLKTFYKNKIKVNQSPQSIKKIKKVEIQDNIFENSLRDQKQKKIHKRHESSISVMRPPQQFQQQSSIAQSTVNSLQIQPDQIKKISQNKTPLRQISPTSRLIQGIQTKEQLKVEKLMRDNLRDMSRLKRRKVLNSTKLEPLDESRANSLERVQGAQSTRNINQIVNQSNILDKQQLKIKIKKKIITNPNSRVNSPKQQQNL